MSVVVMGLGASGRAVCEALVARGHDVVGVDARPSVPPIPGVRLELGPHRRQTFLDAAMIVVSPGIPPTQADLSAAREAGVEVLGEIAFADRFVLDANTPRIGITGTNGKSTTTHFCGQLLAHAGRDPFVGGNLGTPPSAIARPYGCYVLELSSYQLENAGGFRADAGLILNLTPDHLARHGDMAGYAAAKCRLFRNARPDDVCAIPAGDPWLTDAVAGPRGTRAWLGALPGALRTGHQVSVRLPTGEATFDLRPLAVVGEHNKDNAAAALLACLALGVPAETLQDGLSTLTALDHRMQTVPTDDGLAWIDDSKGTNLDSTLAALRGRTHPTVLLLGGQWKGPGFEVLVPHMGAVHTVICFGQHGPDIADELERAGVTPVRVGSLEDAVRSARSHARPGDHVLLSPACASFDAFTDFTHRGREFARLARET